MSRVDIFLKPTNRHMLIVPHFKENSKTESGVLLPESYSESKTPYIRATVVDIASDCSSQFKHLRRGNFSEENDVVVDSSMIEEVFFNNKKNFLILENYVVGILKRL